MALFSTFSILVVLEVAQVHSHLENSLKNSYQSVPEMFLIPKRGKGLKLASTCQKS